MDQEIDGNGIRRALSWSQASAHDKDGIFVMIPNPHHGEKISVKLQLIILKEAAIIRDEWLSAA